MSRALLSWEDNRYRSYCHFVVMYYMSYVELLEFILEKGNNALECLGVLVEKAMTALKEL